MTSAYRRDGVVVRASASQSVDLGFIPYVESYQKTLKTGIHSFPALALSMKKDSVENKLACCVLGQGTRRGASILIWQSGGPPVLHRITIVKLLTQHVVKEDSWIPPVAVRPVGGGATSHRKLV